MFKPTVQYSLHKYSYNTARAAMLRHLLRRRHVVFDLDGTLTVPVHNFLQVRSLFGAASVRGE